MKKFVNQVMSFILALTTVLAMSTTVFAAEQNDKLHRIQTLVQTAELEKEKYGDTTNETAKQLKRCPRNVWS